MSASKIIRHLLKLIYENKELISTIKNILEVFPEAVLIKRAGLDAEEDGLDIKFINNSAIQKLIPRYQQSSRHESLEAINIKMRESKLSDFLNDETELYNSETIKLTDLLKRCEEKVNYSSFSKCLIDF